MTSRGQGICIGIGFGMIVVHAWLAYTMIAMRLYHRAGYFDLMPGFWRLIASPAWLLGIPLLGIAALVTLLIKKPPTGTVYVVVSATLSLTAASTVLIDRVV